MGFFPGPGLVRVLKNYQVEINEACLLVVVKCMPVWGVHICVKDFDLRVVSLCPCLLCDYRGRGSI